MSERRFAIKRDLTLLKQRCNAQMIVVYEGGMFKCDEHLVCYSSIIKDNDVILDVNYTPVKITKVSSSVLRASNKFSISFIVVFLLACG